MARARDPGLAAVLTAVIATQGTLPSPRTQIVLWCGGRILDYDIKSVIREAGLRIEDRPGEPGLVSLLRSLGVSVEHRKYSYRRKSGKVAERHKIVIRDPRIVSAVRELSRSRSRVYDIRWMLSRNAKVVTAVIAVLSKMKYWSELMTYLPRKTLARVLGIKPSNWKLREVLRHRKIFRAASKSFFKNRRRWGAKRVIEFVKSLFDQYDEEYARTKLASLIEEGAVPAYLAAFALNQLGYEFWGEDELKEWLGILEEHDEEEYEEEAIEEEEEEYEEEEW